jgi:hypothetical protein
MKELGLKLDEGGSKKRATPLARKSPRLMFLNFYTIFKIAVMDS